MTDEELDRARADEAVRIYIKQKSETPYLATIAARLAREGWMPDDPLGEEADKIIMDGNISQQMAAHKGQIIHIDEWIKTTVLVALKRGIEIGKEKAGE